jgi:tetrahydromethanopterin S-methyltransferase subunit G
MSHDELSQIISRLDRLESKVDLLSSRFDTHEGGACQREQAAAEIRRCLSGILGGTAIAFFVAVGSFVIAIYNHIGGTK